MKATQKEAETGIFFPDPDFCLQFNPDKASSIDGLVGSSRALHEEIELKYFYEGSSTLLIGNRTVEVTAGDLVVINPYEPHSTIRFGEERGHYRYLLMDLDFFRDGSTGGLDLRGLMLKNGITFRTLIRGDARMGDLFARLTDAYATEHPYRRFSVRGIVLELFALLLSEYAVSPSLERHGDFRAFETVEPALRKIRKDYALPITLEELAELCNVSKCHFCRVFRRVTGQSAMRYLLEYRLKIADLMLSGTGDSIAGIAEQCGFLDQAYFCQCYKAAFGISPRQRRADT